ncbi:MAG: molybdopterin-dependent oxidoreductase, partial [Betaproteobacteria bacterium]|nr:molybdopterin-dependent oxidoreductase [Betaproteobacteria bacterium]
WQSDRSEALLADEHGRDNLHEAELALDGEGRFMALRNHWIANVGAYISSDRNFQASFLNTAGITGVYAFASAHVRLSCVMTHSGSLAPYRGAGRPEATYVLERLIDDAARELGIDRVELRRKNLISAAALPLKTPLGFNFDCGDFETCMNKALDLGDWKGFAARREASREKGMLRGIAVVNPIERAGAPSLEFAELRFDPDGAATLFMGTKNHGQGHETAFRQVLASRLGLAPEDVSFVDGDTDRVLHGTGTFGSRSSGLGGSAISLAADKIIVKGKRIAAHLLEAADADLVFEAGRFSVAGTDRAVSLRQVAQAAWKVGKLPKDIEPGLFESATFEAPDSTFPYGTHVCEVEVDPDTGEVRLDRYTVVDDVGNMINPLLVKGQVHGGIGQGAGQALMERIVYDADSGQLLTGSFMDYAMPRASDLCAFKVDDIVVPTRRNPLGVKGAGEAGAVGALPAVINAVMDALAPLGASKLDMPATAERVWRAINQAGK